VVKGTVIMERILVTGGAGYIGSTLVPKLLGEGYQVTVVDNLMYNQISLLDCCASRHFEFVDGDVCDASLMKKLLRNTDIIIPLAALVGAPACAKNPTLAERINSHSYSWLTKHISQSQRVIFPTTNSGYGIGDMDAFCTELSPLRPVSVYGQHKVEIEEAFLSQGSAVTLRLATVFGMSPRMRLDLLVNDFVYRALNDGYLILFEEHFRRNFIHVSDVAGAFVFALHNFESMRGEPYNVGLSSANLTKRQLAEKIQQNLPGTYLHAAPIGDDPDKRDYLVSNEKIESLGWVANVGLDEGIRELIMGFKIIKLNSFSNR
tara:strand:+ start:678 stop:1634 length:957 start_codon:yes stop_codon:yes gene_type:complete